VDAEDRLEAGGGLALERGERDLRVVWRGLDWLGPLDLAVAGRGAGAPRFAGAFQGSDDLGRFAGWRVDWPERGAGLETRIRAYADEPLLVFRCEAREPRVALATGRFDEPAVAWPRVRPAARRAEGWPTDAGAFGHQYTEFALPTFSDASCAGFFLLPMRPAIVEPLWLRAGDRVLLVAPLDAFHDQVIAVPRGPDEAARGVRCGWHGDLDAVPAGFASEIAVWGGAGHRTLLERHGALLQRRHATARRGRYADEAVGSLSYWTDNGAAYWYRTEAGRDVPGTLEATLAGLREARVPVGAVELDSWFYPHEILRPIDDPRTDVPPTGALVWEARPDALPDGVLDLRRRLGDPPLILHGRHFSSRSPYFDRYPAWRDGDRAHPSTPDLFHALLSQARSWGAVQYEQDWLVESFLGVRGLRERPGRARDWQEGLDRAACANGLSLLWCMATPADFLQTLSLRAVGAIRTSGDYRYLVGSESLWCWFLYGNAFARALGLLPFKDVFLSSPGPAAGGGGDEEGDARSADPHAELEAALSALSAGPVGLGDRLDHTDRGIALRTCRDDGVLVKPDVPVAALERCFRRHAHLWPDPLVADTWSDHPAGRWVYALGLHASRAQDPLEVTLPLAELPLPEGVADWIAWDWRAGSLARLGADGHLAYTLPPRDWRLHVLCPVLPGRIAVVGDPGKYATAGDRRIRRIAVSDGGVAFDVLGAPGERVRVEGWAADGAPSAEAWTPAGGERLEVSPSRAGPDAFRLAVRVGERGWANVRLRPG